MLRMRATFLYTLIQTCTLFSFGFSIDQIEDYGLEPIQQCSANFRPFCNERNSDTLAEESVQLSFCLPFRDPLEIPINHRQCYSTCAFLDPAGFPSCVRCEAAESGDGLLPVNSQTDFYNIYRLRSPGEDTYNPNIICDYRVQCDPGQSMLFTIVTHELEPPPNEGGVCPDTLTIFNTAEPFGEPTCGMELPDRSVLFSFDQMLASFASNGETGSGGFFAFAFCVSDDAHFQRGCGSGRGGGGEDSGEDEDLGIEKRSFRTPHFTVKPGQVVRYTDYTVTVERVSDGKILHKFENIRVLQTYNQFERFVTYHKSADNRFFPGFGKLRIGYGIVQYTQFDINPRFITSPTESKNVNYLIGNLTTAGFFADERFAIIPPGAGPTGPPLPTPSPCLNLNDSGLMEIAMESINSCNGFLRAAAEFFMEVTEMCNSLTPGPVVP